MGWWMMVLAVLAFVTTADAQSYGPPTHSVGDTWKRSNGLELTVVRVDENGVEMTGLLRTCPTCITRYSKNLTILDIVQADGKPLDVTQHGFLPIGSDWRFFDFPLELKKTWRFTPQGWFRGSSARYTVDATVVAFEDVKTKAGIFKAYKINYEWTVHTSFGDFRWNTQYWFAPDVKFGVKGTSTARGVEDWELISYKVK